MDLAIGGRFGDVTVGLLNQAAIGRHKLGQDDDARSLAADLAAVIDQTGFVEPDWALVPEIGDAQKGEGDSAGDLIDLARLAREMLS
jgi:hypothetical protein